MKNLFYILYNAITMATMSILQLGRTLNKKNINNILDKLEPLILTKQEFSEMIDAYHCSMAIYNDDPTPRLSSIFKHYDNIDEEIDGTRIIITNTDTTTYATIRGSDNIKNWVTNFTIVSNNSDTIHVGYLKKARKLQQHITQHAQHPITLMGHSKGGALAILTAHLLENKGHEIKKVWAFGVPKFAALLESSKNTITIIDSSDPVPYMPVKSKHYNYNHNGETWYYDNYSNKWYRFAATDDVDPLLEIQNLRTFLSVKSHLSYYVKLLKIQSL